MNTNLAAILKKFIDICQGVYLWQFYRTQIMYESLNKFISSHPGSLNILKEYDWSLLTFIFNEIWTKLLKTLLEILLVILPILQIK